MIPSPYRLLLTHDKFIGKVFRFPWGLIITKSSPLKQFAISVSKRVDKRAVYRNHLRRQLVHFCYQNRNQFGNFQHLIIPKFLPSSSQLANIKVDLLSLIQKMH